MLRDSWNFIFEHKSVVSALNRDFSVNKSRNQKFCQGICSPWVMTESRNIMLAEGWFMNFQLRGREGKASNPAATPFCLTVWVLWVHKKAPLWGDPVQICVGGKFAWFCLFFNFALIGSENFSNRLERVVLGGRVHCIHHSKGSNSDPCGCNK